MLSQTPLKLDYQVNQKKIAISTLQKQYLQKIQQNLWMKNQVSINIFASGASIVDIEFSESLLTMPAIFVNGSIALTLKYTFTSQAAYVISDARFIEHSPDLFLTHYIGQPLFITQAVFEKILALSPQTIEKYQQHIILIHAVDRPLLQPDLNIIQKLLRKKKQPLSMINDTDIVIQQCDPCIGVSLDMSKGFVEAGTVAYVATQLAYSFGAKQIYLYGVDLINTTQPRFYESQESQAPCKLDKAVQNRIIPAFELLARTYKQHDVQVYNCSPVSKNLFKYLSYFE